MLTEWEKAGIQDILKILTKEDLKSLAVTVSKAQVQLDSNAECVKAILAFEKNADEFLRRRVMSRKILTQYAYETNIQNVSECRSKEDLARLIVKHWTEVQPTKQVTPHLTASQTEHVPTPPTQITNNTYNYYQVNYVAQSNTLNQETHYNNNSQSAVQPDEDFELGKSFCKWFYGMLNHADPVSKGFGSTHFMPQAQLFTSFISSANTTEDSHTDSNAISNVFLSLSKRFNFNPNVSKEGMRVKSDPHGVKLILICGTLLTDMSLCGTFQQSFGIVKDASGNWKIQVTALRCVEHKNPALPFLDDSVNHLESSTVECLQRSLNM